MDIFKSKSLSLATALVLGLSFVGCGDDDDDSTTNTETNATDNNVTQNTDTNSTDNNSTKPTKEEVGEVNVLMIMNNLSEEAAHALVEDNNDSADFTHFLIDEEANCTEYGFTELLSTADYESVYQKPDDLNTSGTCTESDYSEGNKSGNHSLLMGYNE
jgi:hypothetical protein